MYVIILLLSATMPCTSIAVVMIGPSKERYVISTLVPFHRETESARLLPPLLSLPLVTTGSLAFEPPLIITTYSPRCKQPDFHPNLPCVQYNSSICSRQSYLLSCSLFTLFGDGYSDQEKYSLWITSS